MGYPWKRYDQNPPRGSPDIAVTRLRYERTDGQTPKQNASQEPTEWRQNKHSIRLFHQISACLYCSYYKVENVYIFYLLDSSSTTQYTSY